MNANDDKDGHMTPQQVLDLVMTTKLPAGLQRSLYAIIRGYETSVSQNKFLLMMALAAMVSGVSDEDREGLLNGEVKLRIEKDVWDSIKPRLALARPVLNYHEDEAQNGFIKLGWKPKEQPQQTPEKEGQNEVLDNLQG